MGQAHQLSGNHKAALKSYLSSLSHYLKLKDRFGEASIQKKLGDVYRLTENFSKAEKSYSRAYALSSSPDPLTGIALSIRGRGNYKGAIKLLIGARALYEKSNDRAGTAYVAWALGTTYRFLGQLDKAEKFLKESLKIYTELKDEGGIAYARCALGGTLRIQGDARHSFDLYRRSELTFRKFKDLFGLAYSLCGQGNALRMQNRFKESVAYFQRAIKGYSAIGQMGPRAYVLWNLSQSLIALGKKSSAAKSLQQAGAIFRKVKDRRGWVYVLLGWGEFQKSDNPSQSKTFFLKALRTSARLQSPLETFYARRGLFNRAFDKEFKKLGVKWPLFKKYLSIP